MTKKDEGRTTPPEGWHAFGTHVDQPGPLEFSDESGEDGLPLWERPLETRTEYGLRLDCALAGHGDNPCREDGEVLPRKEHQTRTIERVNGHAVTPVERTVVYGPWGRP